MERSAHDITSMGRSLPVRERGLKLQEICQGQEDLEGSLPVRERGLKSVPDFLTLPDHLGRSPCGSVD